MDVRNGTADTTVRFIDDLDGSDAAGTFDFAIDGRQYQIDLSDENAAKLRDALAPDACQHGRPVVVLADERCDRPRWRTSLRGANRDQTAAIRDWARANGHQVSDRGRISKSVMDDLPSRELTAT